MSEDDGYTMVPLESHGFFWVTFRGEISLDRLARSHDAFTSHPDYSPGIDELLDFTEGSIKQLTRKEIEVMRGYMTSQPDRHHCKSAIVVSSKVEYGLGRMLGLSLDQDVPVDRWIGYSLREALDWLRPGQADELVAAREKMLLAGGSY